MTIMKNKKSSLLPLIVLFLGIAILMVIRGVVIGKKTDLNYFDDSIEEFGIQTIAQELPRTNTFSYLPFYEKLRENLILKNESFVEINLSKMKTLIYKNGKLSEEYSILTQGNSEDWEGGPAGLYTVKSKHILSSSNSANIYIPFTIGYYGKYYIHGIPYYSDSNKEMPNDLKGSLKHSDKDAKIIFNFLNKGMPILVIDKEQDSYVYPEKETTVFPELSAESYIVADIDSGFILQEKNSNKKYSIASITKLMTAVTVVENVGIEKTIKVTEEMLDVYGSNPGFEVGKKYSISQLLPPLLTRSTNQAAEILAHFLGREKTIRFMNEKAKNIMMDNTSFEDPSGLSENNISTGRDLFYLLRYIINNRSSILKITKGEYIDAQKDQLFTDDELGNRNIFIYDPTFVGGKIGFTDIARHTGAFLFNLEIGGQRRNIAIILLKSQNLKYDTQKSYIWLLDNYFEKPENY